MTDNLRHLEFERKVGWKVTILHMRGRIEDINTHGSVSNVMLEMSARLKLSPPGSIAVFYSYEDSTIQRILIRNHNGSIESYQ